MDMAGAASNYRDVKDFSHNDLIIMMLATFALIFIIVLAITRALVGSIIVLVTVISRLPRPRAGGLYLGNLLHTQLHWLNCRSRLSSSYGVGCDYNLFLLSRYRERPMPASRRA